MANKRLTNPKPFTKNNINTVPKQSGIYVVRDKKGNPLYVGKAGAGRLQRRLAEHLNNKDIRGAVSFQYRTTTSSKEANKLEKKYIKRLKPKYNKQLKPT